MSDPLHDALVAVRDGAALDSVAIVEAWWRAKGRMLQNTHAPNLEAVRIDTRDIAELIRLIRALASDPPTAGPPAVPALPSGARQQEWSSKIPDDPNAHNPVIQAMRAASAASPNGSAEDGSPDCSRCHTTMFLRAGCEWPEDLATAVCDSCAQELLVELREQTSSAESAAYARGRKERDAEWREALRLQENGELCGASMRTILWEADHPEDPYRHECADCAPLRALLLGSVATEPKAPPSPSGALAGSEEPTTKEKSK